MTSASKPPKAEPGGKVHVGSRVVYHPVGHAVRTSVGKVTKIITRPEEVGSRHAMVKASEDEPRYLIENEHTRKEAAYKPDSIVKVLN